MFTRLSTPIFCHAFLVIHEAFSVVAIKRLFFCKRNRNPLLLMECVWWVCVGVRLYLLGMCVGVFVIVVCVYLCVVGVCGCVCGVSVSFCVCGVCGVCMWCVCLRV